MSGSEDIFAITKTGIRDNEIYQINRNLSFIKDALTSLKSQVEGRQAEDTGSGSGVVQSSGDIILKPGTGNAFVNDNLILTDAHPDKSIELNGTTLELDGDITSPGNSMYYGTNVVGSKGFHLLPSAPSSPNLTVPYIIGVTAIDDKGAPSATRFFLNTHKYVTLLDLAQFSECRIVVNRQGVVGAAGYSLGVVYRSAGFSPNVIDYSSIGTSPVSVNVSASNTVVASSWIALTAGAKSDVAVAVTSTNGDGVIDPIFGSIFLQFR